ncbi:MAG: four-helix bundle copper-binding protein [Trueperaceae bacterium]|nr:four-helix bundle copper-binding protein [Trueperaceae bacterium]
MQHIGSMLSSHPRAGADDTDARARTVAALHACAQACTSCADACLAEDDVASLTRCIRTDLDCADVCAATARLLSRLTETDGNLVRAQLEACVVACRTCAEECEGHADHMEHCRLCAEMCRACERECMEVMRALSA